MSSQDFDALLGPVRDRLYAVALRVTGSEADALDALQEGLLRIYRGLDGWDRRAAFSTWAHRIVLHCALDLLRRRRRGSGHAYEGEEGEMADPRSPEGHVPITARERADVVRRVLASLPERQRTVLTLRHYEDLPLAEIAAVLGIAVGTVKATLSQGLRNLRLRLEGAHETL